MNHSSSKSELIGHEKAFQSLLNLYQQQTLSPCWLLNGQQGIGKATFALAFARHVLAKNTVNPDGLSPDLVQRQIQAGSYPNLLIIQKPITDGEEAGEIPLSEAKRVLNFLAHSAIIPGWRVVIVDAANELNRSASNCLLKIVEEPPPKTVILLVCHAWGQVLPTLRSRCQRLDFSPLTTDDVKDLSIDNDLFAVCQGSLGYYQQLVNAGGVEFLRTVTTIIQAARQGQWIQLQKFCQDTGKLPNRFECLLWLLPNLIYQKTIETKSPDWLTVAQKLNAFLEQAKTSHLDKTQFLVNCFLLIENPNC
ncbi:hypothetical protein [Candidatus Finniella inopinata]|uniref:DNA polymerase III subunit delta n=1 Tax=Candidatus Finniella inopinata TaxID=1696036 RepID=A0A4Q7DL07_9PROT|nr:hypothetical protein [Candidatus Finniella inopinata]RZI46915.1 hypothetical protein EQU50_01435 [Candidatus Finniella inopinata]